MWTFCIEMTLLLKKMFNNCGYVPEWWRYQSQTASKAWAINNCIEHCRRHNRIELFAHSHISVWKSALAPPQHWHSVARYEFPLLDFFFFHVPFARLCVYMFVPLIKSTKTAFIVLDFSKDARTPFSPERIYKFRWTEIFEFTVICNSITCAGST